MRTAAHGLRLLPGAAKRARTKPNWLTTTFIVVLGLALLVWVTSGTLAERRALRQLPEPQKRQLLSMTVDEMKQFCSGNEPDALKDHCRELASFAAEFDACEGECAELVHRQLSPAPTR